MKNKELATSYFISLIIPILAAVSSKNKLLSFIDTWTIIGLILLMLGIFSDLCRRGYIDLFYFSIYKTSYMFSKNNESMDFYEYKLDKAKSRKNKPNMILRTAFLVVGSCVILTLVYMNF